MKILYRKCIFPLILISFFSCNAQQVQPLNADYDIFPNNSYYKDLNGELNPYIGIFKANYQGNEITIFISKEENRYTQLVDKTFYRDALVIKFVVKNSSGTILQDNLSNTNNKIHSIGTKPNLGQVILYYEGTNCGVGWGKIILKKLNSTQISWTYGANSSVITNQNCPGNPNLTVYLPQTQNLIFTKQ